MTRFRPGLRGRRRNSPVTWIALNSIHYPFQCHLSTVSVLAATFGTSLEPRGEVVIVMHSDGPEEMEITLINCQADKSDEAACHHIP